MTTAKIHTTEVAVAVQVDRATALKTKINNKPHTAALAQPVIY
jgi:hypothetical protein